MDIKVTYDALRHGGETVDNFVDEFREPLPKLQRFLNQRNGWNSLVNQKLILKQVLGKLSGRVSARIQTRFPLAPRIAYTVHNFRLGCVSPLCFGMK